MTPTTSCLSRYFLISLLRENITDDCMHAHAPGAYFNRGRCRAESSGAGDQIQTAGLLVVEVHFRHEQQRELLTDAVSEVRVG